MRRLLKYLAMGDVYTKKDVTIVAPSPAKRLHPSSDANSATPSSAISSHLDVDFIVEDAIYQQPATERKPAKRYASSQDDPLKEWLSVREQYLLEFVRLDGPGDGFFSECGICGIQSCCISSHVEQPLHRIEQWNSKFFKSTSLQAAGLRIQLGHPPSSPCPVQTTINDFVVLHTNGIHIVTLSFCACDQRSKHGTSMQQLLRRQWFPATFEQPHTCATFSLLQHFQLQTLQGKTTSYDYYSAVRLLTDNSGITTIPMRYKEFLRINREYVHILSLKRGGRAHEDGGASGTKPGELAVVCPACPDDEVNLLLNWQSAPDDKKRALLFLYTLYLALDACFRLKRRMVSSLDKDPGLGADWGYFVEGEPFRQYLLSVTDQKEMSTCSGFAALDYANTKFSRGYAATGVCLVVCARHEFIQPNGVADLQVGERYANMDYIFASAVKNKSRSIKILVSYDIACQWSKNVIARLKNLPPSGTTSSSLSDASQSFSLNYLSGVGWTDGEGVERPWANIGATSTSIRVMGPGARVETLNNHWSHWNWQKVVGLGTLLSKRLRAAVSERDLQQSAFDILSTKQGTHVETWRKMVEAFELDSSQPNPYSVPERKRASKKRERPAHDVIAEEPAKDDAVPLANTPAGFIALGFDIFDQQQNIKSQATNTGTRRTSGRSSLDTDLTHLRTELTQSLAQFWALQTLFMPQVERVTINNEDPETIPIILPSSLSHEDMATCREDLIDSERTFRESRCGSALDRLRNLLVIKSRLLAYKNRHARNQGPNTRTRAIINRNQEKIHAQSSAFQSSWLALKALAHGDEENLPWPELTTGAIRCLTDPDVHDGHQVRLARRGEHGQQNVILVSRDTEGDEGDGSRDVVAVIAKEGFQTVSWIWEDAKGADIDDVLRCEWAKAWARLRRWQEEVELLKEEMRRTLVSLRYQASVWERRSQRSFDDEFGPGLKAYALAQANLRLSLASKFAEMWKKGTDNSDQEEPGLDEDEVAEGEGAHTKA
ncbi:hypothetical protein ONZ45_g4299 [Pleurotus djamor]|nr:hypothetical protein ONZ45_g4299 [Pleurotus djamor]